MRKVMPRLVMMAAFGFLTPGTTRADMVLEYISALDSTFSTNATAGWSFTTNQAITVTALDAYTGGGHSSYNVRLYNASGTIIASATVLNTDPVEGTSFTVYSQAITPVTLSADTTYYIAEDVLATTTSIGFRASGISTDPSITFGGGVSSNGLGGTPTSDIYGGVYNPAYFGPDFDIASAAVPEPSSMILIGLAIGAVGLGAWRRRRRGPVESAV